MNFNRLLWAAAFFALASIFFVTAPAAAQGVTCGMMVQVVDHGSLTANAGTYSTRGATIVATPECTHEGSGLYVNLPVILPMVHDGGEEVDVRAGWRGTVGRFKLDVSVANYAFRADGRNWNTFNVQGSVSHRFTLGANAGLAPYMKADYLRSWNGAGSSLAFGAGTVFDWKVPVVGNPALTVDGSAWIRPYNTLASGHGLVLALDTSLLFPAKMGDAKFNVGPIFMLTHGSVDPRRKHGVQQMVGVRFTAGF